MTFNLQIFCLFLFIFTLPNGLESSTTALKPKVICYFTSWAQWRFKPAKFLPEDINPNICTHIIYAFAKVFNNSLIPSEPSDDDDITKGMYRRVTKLKDLNPKLKVLIGLQGEAAVEPFITILKDADMRRGFVSSSVEYIKKYNFDGLEIVWKSSSSHPKHKKRFNFLINELKTEFELHGMLLSVAVKPNKKVIDNSYELDIISQDVDWITILTYDFHSQSDRLTGHNAPLYGRGNDSETQNELNIDWTVNYYISKGASIDKLILGIPLFGKVFSLANSNNNYVNASSTLSPVTPGKFTKISGILSYYETCNITDQGWTRVWDNEQKVPYAYKDDEWLTYEDLESLKYKLKYVKKKQLGGVMYWNLDYDNFNGEFCSNEKYPMISYALKELNSKFECKSDSDCKNGGQCDLNLGDCKCVEGYVSTNCRQYAKPFEEKNQTSLIDVKGTLLQKKSNNSVDSKLNARDIKIDTDNNDNHAMENVHDNTGISNRNIDFATNIDGHNSTKNENESKNVKNRDITFGDNNNNNHVMNNVHDNTKIVDGSEPAPVNDEPTKITKVHSSLEITSTIKAKSVQSTSTIKAKTTLIKVKPVGNVINENQISPPKTNTYNKKTYTTTKGED